MVASSIKADALARAKRARAARAMPGKVGDPPLGISPAALNASFLAQAAKAAGDKALDSASSAGISVVGVRDGRPVIREPDGSERTVEWSEFGLAAPD